MLKILWYADTHYFVWIYFHGKFEEFYGTMKHQRAPPLVSPKCPSIHLMICFTRLAGASNLPNALRTIHSVVLHCQLWSQSNFFLFSVRYFLCWWVHESLVSTARPLNQPWPSTIHHNSLQLIASPRTVAKSKTLHLAVVTKCRSKWSEQGHLTFDIGKGNWPPW